jgi:soluble lytic murein transglycosylase-like protein
VRFGRHFAAALLLASVVGPTGTLAQDVRPVRAAAVHPYAAHVTEAARRFGIPEAWIWAVMRVESGGNRTAVSRAGAIGLMQIMPGTWAQLRARHGLGPDPFDARDNIMAGAAYLREMHNRYGNVTAMLAAYNAGPGRYDAYLSRARSLPAETIAYLAMLAPIMGETAAVQVAAAPPPDPYAWRRAALFVRTASAADVASVAQSDSGIAAPDASADAPAGGDAGDSIAAVPSHRSAPADTLFIPRAGAGRPQ